MQHWIGACVVVVVLLVDVVVELVVVDVVVELVVVDVVVELVVLLVVELVVVEVVVVDELVVVVAPTGQVGRPASFVQVQRNALHCVVIFLAHWLPLELGPHAAKISSAQEVFLSHLPD